MRLLFCARPPASICMHVAALQATAADHLPLLPLTCARAGRRDQCLPHCHGHQWPSHSPAGKVEADGGAGECHRGFVGNLTAFHSYLSTPNCRTNGRVACDRHSAYLWCSCSRRKSFARFPSASLVCLCRKMRWALAPTPRPECWRLGCRCLWLLPTSPLARCGPGVCFAPQP